MERHPPTNSGHARLVLLACGLLVAGGCYTGLDDPEPAGNTFGDGGGIAEGDGDGGGDGNDDNEVPPRAGGDEDEPDAPFGVPGNEVQLLPFPVRMANLSKLAGVGPEHPIFAEAYDLRLLLGDHDYSALSAPDLRWSPERMQNWVKALKPVCASPEVIAKYPNLVGDPSSMMRDAFGREPTPDDLEPMLDIASSTLFPTTKYQLACTAVLASLEFVAQ